VEHCRLQRHRSTSSLTRLPPGVVRPG
jgi:hypothetical protein